MAPNALTELLGLPTHRQPPPDYLMNEVERGLPLVALDRVAEAVAPGDVAFTHRLVPRATLARRRQALNAARDDASSRLSAEESARVARLAEIWSFAREVWGSDEAARDFLFRAHPILQGRRPIDVVLANEFGRPLVEGILGRLQYGSAA